MKMLTDYERGYLEGILDGEGSLSVRKNKAKNYRAGYEFVPLCFVSNTDHALLVRIQKIVGSGSIVVHSDYPNKAWKKAWRYNMPRQKMRELLPQLRLVAREKQRKLLLKALGILQGHKGLGNHLKQRNVGVLDGIVRDIRLLNRRGQIVKIKI